MAMNTTLMQVQVYVCRYSLKLIYFISVAIQTVLLQSSDAFKLEDVLNFFYVQLKKFLDSESVFASNNDDAVVISNLIKANKVTSNVLFHNILMK